ncbi:LysR substrate-binding domain-containing protein [Pseudomonas aeruginosa]
MEVAEGRSRRRAHPPLRPLARAVADGHGPASPGADDRPLRRTVPRRGDRADPVPAQPRTCSGGRPGRADHRRAASRSTPRSSPSPRPGQHPQRALCASPGYLQRHGVPRSVDDPERHARLRLQDPAYPEVDLRRRAGRAHRQPAEHFMVNVAEVMAQAAKADLGIALLPSYVAARARNGELLRVLPGQPCTSGPSMRCIPRGVGFRTRRSAPGSTCCNRNFPQASARDDTTMQFKLLGTVKDCCYWR